MNGLFLALAGVSALGGMGVLLAVPELALAGFGHPLLPGIMHLLTLGVLLSAAYAIQDELWRRLYGRGVLAPWFLGGIFVFHLAGLLIMLWGMFNHNTLMTHLGGHYFIPTGIALGIVYGLVTAWRRPKGISRHFSTHLPGLGLAVGMSLGALMVMDAVTGQYGIYTLDTIFLHALAGAFLFCVPLIRLRAALSRTDPSGGGVSVTTGDMARWYALAGLTGLGVLLAALALLPNGSPLMLAGSLALLGCVTLWNALPSRWTARAALKRISRRAGWLGVGLLLLYAGIRVGRGADMVELLRLGNYSGLAFLLALALPDFLTEMGGQGAGRPAAAGSGWRHGLWLTGAGVILGGQVWAEPLLVRSGAALWLGGLAVWGAILPRAGRQA